MYGTVLVTIYRKRANGYHILRAIVMLSSCEWTGVYIHARVHGPCPSVCRIQHIRYFKLLWYPILDFLEAPPLSVNRSPSFASRLYTRIHTRLDFRPHNTIMADGKLHCIVVHTLALGYRGLVRRVQAEAK